MIIDQKKIAQVILSKRKPDGTDLSAPMPSEEGIGADGPGVEICQDILMAIKNDSASDLWQAIKAAVQAADSDDSEGSEPAESEE